MMKRVIGLMCAVGTIFLMNQTIYAEKLNVLTQSTDSKIYLNNLLVGTHQLLDYEINKGTYILKVMDMGVAVYQKTIEIPEGQTISIDVSGGLVEAHSPMADKGPLSREALRVRESRGNFGIGVNLGVIPGLSMRCFLTRNIGIEANGWYSSRNSEKFSAWEARGIYVLSNSLINNMPGNGYVVLSVGDNNGTLQSKELGLGLEASAMTVFGNGGYLGFLRTDNSYFNVEIVYADYLHENDDHYQGFAARAGFRYYF